MDLAEITVRRDETWIHLDGVLLRLLRAVVISAKVVDEPEICPDDQRFRINVASQLQFSDGFLVPARGCKVQSVPMNCLSIAWVKRNRALEFPFNIAAFHMIEANRGERGVRLREAIIQLKSLFRRLFGFRNIHLRRSDLVEIGRASCR